MNKNDKNILAFVEKMVNYNDHIKNAQEYIKENYNVKSSFDDETNTLYIYSTNINESLNVVAAKEYINDTIGEDFVTVEYGYNKE